MNSGSLSIMSYEGYKVSFLSYEAESRCHVSVENPTYTKAKFWMTPSVELDYNTGLPSQEISRILDLLIDQSDYIIQFWNRSRNKDVPLAKNRNPILLSRPDRNRIYIHAKLNEGKIINASRLIEKVLKRGIEEGTIVLSQ